MTDIVQMDELEEAERQAAKPAWKTKQFWHSAVPILISAVLLTVGTVLAAKHYQTQVCFIGLLQQQDLRNLCASYLLYVQIG